MHLCLHPLVLLIGGTKWGVRSETPSHWSKISWESHNMLPSTIDVFGKPKDNNDIWWKRPWSPLCFTQSYGRGPGISGVILLECAITALLPPVSNIRIICYICSICFIPQLTHSATESHSRICEVVLSSLMCTLMRIMWRKITILIQHFLTGAICLLKKGTWYKLLS